MQLTHSQWDSCMSFLLALILSVKIVRTFSKYKKYLSLQFMF